MWKAKISFRTEDGVVKNHKFFSSSAKCSGVSKIRVECLLFNVVSRLRQSVSKSQIYITQ